MTPAIATQEREPEPDVDQAHEVGPDRPYYRVSPPDDGGLWRGPTEAAWTTRILRGARPPKAPAALPVQASTTRP